MDAAGSVSLPAIAGRFRLEEKLEDDGASETYRAVDTEGGGPALVRVVRSEGGSARRERLIREAKRAAQVKHEGLAAVLDVGVTDSGDAFVAVETPAGERLSERLGRGAPLPEREAAGIATQITRALAVAHDAGVVHRDLRPSAIVLSGEGDAMRVKVTGLATPRLPASSSAVTSDDPDSAFAAPEHRRGEAAGRRADVYSIGAMLYAMLTGRPPAPGASAITTPLGDVVRRCLAEDPRERFLDTIALGAALRMTMDSAPPPSSARIPSSPSLPEPVVGRPPAAPPPRPLGRPLTARPRWEEALLDLREGPLPQVFVTLIVAFVVARILTSGLVPYVVAVIAAIAAYATKYWRGSRSGR
jgi:serine/threonine-protein kinase